ncbi:MAG: RNA 3'-terminal phosphate cyclase [Planctomycetales bacterium]|nr:RNA 3'-terminal phosphate cyclase [Planctomycetales bacterium]
MCVEIDGSQGEGGGQILRSSLTLSLITGKSVRLTKIRAGREKPGLMRQHLTAVRAAAEVGEAKLEGADVRSCELKFEPQTIRTGQFAFAVGTAGSGTLVLQTVLPALLIGDGPSEVTVEGGTHNPWAPPFDFLAKSYFPLLQQMGANVTASLERLGFYPAGGGRFHVSIHPPTDGLRGLQLQERGAIKDRCATAIVANLPLTIGQRELDTIAQKLSWPTDCFQLCESPDTHGPGNVVLIEICSEHVSEVFTGFGRHGARAERVASEAVDQVRDYLSADVPVGKYLADQLILPLSIAAWKYGAKSKFRTLPLSRHSTTHLEIVQKFLDVTVNVSQQDAATLVSIG